MLQLHEGAVVVRRGKVPLRSVGGVGFVKQESVSHQVTSYEILWCAWLFFVSNLRVEPESVFTPDGSEPDSFYNQLEELTLNEKFYKFISMEIIFLRRRKIHNGQGSLATTRHGDQSYSDQNKMVSFRNLSGSWALYSIGSPYSLCKVWVQP